MKKLNLGKIVFCCMVAAILVLALIVLPNQSQNKTHSVNVSASAKNTTIAPTTYTDANGVIRSINDDMPAGEPNLDSGQSNASDDTSADQNRAPGDQVDSSMGLETIDDYTKAMETIRRIEAERAYFNH